MAKMSGITSKLSGKIGEMMFAQRNGRTIVYEAPVMRNTRRSEQQMSLRAQWANLAAVFRLFDGKLSRGFENLPSNMTAMNAFMQANIDMVKVYITKSMHLNGGCVLAPYQITRGSLPSISMSMNGSNILISSLSVGELAINAQTTVAQFSEAIIGNNPEWVAGDQLTFFYGQQTTDAVTGVPRATMTPNKVVMDMDDETPLWNVVGSEGFTTVDGHLGMSSVLTAGAAAWVHSRDTEQGGLKVSTQYLYVENAALASYQTSAAITASVNSYGGVNTGVVYLKPTSKGNIGVSAAASAASGSSSSETQGSSESQTPGGSSPESNGTGEN